jgi:protocatechuate 3,4-dioxygenase beta subunit
MSERIITAQDQLASLEAVADSPDIQDYIQLVEAHKAPEGSSPITVEGPFYESSRELVRADITEGRPGIPLELRLAVRDVASGAAVTGALVEVWHCDASGLYSGHLNLDPDGIPATGLAHLPAADDSRFLRGTQSTGGDGVAKFHTIYPGWYFARSIHIHLKAHVAGREVYTGQVYLPEECNDAVETLPPYNAHGSLERLRNADDVLYKSMGGAQLLVDAMPVDARRPEAGFVGSFTLSIGL